MKKLLYSLILISGLAYGQSEPISPESVTTNQISPISASAGLALKNNAGTSIAIIGVGSSSSTNSTWTGNIVQTGTLSTQALTATNTTNQFAIGTTNVTTLNFPAPSGSATLTFPLVTSTLYGTGSGTITSSQMATSVSDEIGSDKLVFGTNPTAFTVVVADASSGGNTGTYDASSDAFYTRFGKQVTVYINLVDINTTGMTAGNDLWFRSLPFVNSAEMNAIGIVDCGFLTFTGQISARMNANTSTMRISEMTSGATADFVMVSEISSGVTDIRIQITYFTD